jgi:hypothetical protein
MANDILQFGAINKRASEFLKDSLATEHIKAHVGKEILDVGFLGKQIVILFDDMAQMTFEIIGQMGLTTEPSAIIGSKFESLYITNNYSVNDDTFTARVFITTRFGKKSSMLTVNYTIPLMRTVELDYFPARIFTTYLNEVGICHATQETTKKNTKPMTEHQQSVQKGQNETKQEDSLPKKAKSTKATAKMSTTLSPFQREAVRAGVISVSEMLQRIGHTQELPTPR